MHSEFSKAAAKSLIYTLLAIATILASIFLVTYIYENFKSITLLTTLGFGKRGAVVMLLIVAAVSGWAVFMRFLARAAFSQFAAWTILAVSTVISLLSLRAISIIDDNLTYQTIDYFSLFAFVIHAVLFIITSKKWIDNEI